MSEAAELLISQAIAREQLVAEFDLLARISGTDGLTGIANRRRWDESTKALLAELDSQQAVVLSCDLDGLKAVNDRYGHAAGDALIRATANLLTTCVREGDLVARIGGDEFAVLLRGSDAKAAALVRRRVRRAEHGWRVTGHGLRVRLSFGLAEVHGNDVGAAHARADQLMYANKRRRSASAGLTIPTTNVDRRTRRR